MPYIMFAQFPETIGVGRTATNVSYRLDGSHWVGDVDAVLAGEQEVDEATYYAMLKENAAWDKAHPPVEPEPEPQPTPEPSALVQLLEVLGKDKALAPETQQAIAALAEG